MKSPEERRLADIEDKKLGLTEPPVMSKKLEARLEKGLHGAMKAEAYDHAEKSKAERLQVLHDKIAELERRAAAPSSWTLKEDKLKIEEEISKTDELIRDTKARNAAVHAKRLTPEEIQSAAKDLGIPEKEEIDLPSSPILIESPAPLPPAPEPVSDPQRRQQILERLDRRHGGKAPEATPEPQQAQVEAATPELVAAREALAATNENEPQTRIGKKIVTAKGKKLYVTKQEGTPEWRKLGKNDERLNEKKPEAPEQGLGRNRVLEAQSSGVTQKQAALAEHIKKQQEHDALVAERREVRSEKFAEKFGLTELRNAKIAAERAAYEEDLKHHKNPLRRVFAPTPEKREAARRKADKATLEWSKALANLPEGATNREKAEALIIRKRDTLIAPNAMRTQARVDALDERGKTAYGKVLNGLGSIALSPLKLSSWASGKIGGGLFKVFGNKKLKGDALEKEQALYRRAGQVIMGATIGSVLGIVAGPGGLAAAAGVIGFSSVRALLGTAAGTATGYGASFINKHTIDKSTKEDYKKEVRNTGVENIHSLQKQQLAEKHGSRANRQKRAQKIKVGAAILGGAAVSLELGQFAHLPSVQNALHHHPPITPEHPKVPLEMKIGGTNAEGVNLNDSDKLFGHFGLMLQRDFAHVPHTQTPSIDTYLKLLQTPGGHGVSLHGGEDHMARAFGFEGHKGLSEVMHKDDTIMLDTKGEMVIKWADHRPSHILISADGKINTNIDDITAHMRMPHAAEQAAAPATTPENAAVPSAPEAPSAAGSENLGAAPEPDYSNVLPAALARARAVDAYNAAHSSVVNAVPAVPSTSEVVSHQPASIASPEAQNPISTPSVGVPSGIETTTNSFHFNVDHGYEVVDPSTGESGLAFYGPHGPTFMAELQKFAQAHPGQPIQFDSPTPTIVSGVPRPWVNTAVYDPQQGFTTAALIPDNVGTKLDPTIFKREIY